MEMDMDIDTDMDMDTDTNVDMNPEHGQGQRRYNSPTYDRLNWLTATLLDTFLVTSNTLSNLKQQ